MSTEENSNQEQNNPGKESAKIKQSYDKAMSSLVAIFKGESNIAIVKKIPNDEVKILMDEVLEEEVTAIKDTFKTKAKELIKAKVAYDNFIKQKEQEIQKAKDEKTKEFTKNANELIQMVESIGTLQKDYLEALTPQIEEATETITTQEQE